MELSGIIRESSLNEVDDVFKSITNIPDFDKLLVVYQQTNDLKKILGPLYGRMLIKEKNDELYLFHKTVYNFKLLSELLVKAGFKDVLKYDWRQTEHSDYDDHSQAYFPHMDKKNGILISLNVEAKK